MKVSLNYKNALLNISEQSLKENKNKVLEAKETLVNKSGAGNDFLGWVEYPKNYDQEEFEFLDGRMLLRGSNGSGKSVTMQSFIPRSWHLTT